MILKYDHINIFPFSHCNIKLMQVFSTKITDYYVLIAAEQLGFDNYIPPFATARGMEILKGVNYASGSAGIRNETGRQKVIYYLMQGHYSIFFTT